MRILVKILIILTVFKMILIAFQLPFDLRILFRMFSVWLHQNCLSSLSHLSHVADAHASAKALVCGHEIENLNVRHLFTSTGLIHLLVVSGSHLIIFKKILEFFLTQIQSVTKKLTPNTNSMLVFSLLFVYVLMCLMNPPVTRSYIGLFIAFVADRWKFRWPPTTQHFLTSSISLWINPFWISSLSFQMSWLASLALNLSQEIFQDTAEENKFKMYWQQSLIRTFFIYFSFVFLFCYFGFPHPLVPLYSIILTPILEIFLFPLALLAAFGSYFSFLYLNLFSGIIKLLNILEIDKPSGFFLTHTSVANANLFLISAFLYLLIFFRKKST